MSESAATPAHELFDLQKKFIANAQEFYDEEFFSITVTNSRDVQKRATWLMSLRITAILTSMYCHDIILPYVIEELTFNDLYDGTKSCIISKQTKQIQPKKFNHIKSINIMNRYFEIMSTDPAVLYFLRYLHFCCNQVNNMMPENSESSSYVFNDLKITENDASLDIFRKIYLDCGLTEFNFFKYLLYNSYHNVSPGSAFCQNRLIDRIKIYIRAIPDKKFVFHNFITKKDNYTFYKESRAELKKFDAIQKKYGYSPQLITDIWTLLSTILDGRTFYTRILAKSNYHKVSVVLAHETEYLKYSIQLVNMAKLLYNSIAGTSDATPEDDEVFLEFTKFTAQRENLVIAEENKIWGGSQNRTDNGNENENEEDKNNDDQEDSGDIKSEKETPDRTKEENDGDDFSDSDNTNRNNNKKEEDAINDDGDDLGLEDEQTTTTVTTVNTALPTETDNPDPDENEKSGLSGMEEENEEIDDQPHMMDEQYQEDDENKEEDRLNSELRGISKIQENRYIAGKPYAKTIPLNSIIMEKILKIIVEIPEEWLDIVRINDRYSINIIFSNSRISEWINYFASFPVQLAPFMVTTTVNDSAKNIYGKWKKTYNKAKISMDHEKKAGTEEYSQKSDEETEPIMKVNKYGEDEDEGQVDDVDKDDSEEEMGEENMAEMGSFIVSEEDN